MYRKLTSFGLPRRYPIIQFPNLLLIASLLAGMVSQHVHGTAHDYARAVSLLGMGIWAYEEVSSGINWGRRLLGLAFLVIMFMRVVHAIR